MEGAVLLRANDVAERLGVSPRTIQAWVQEGLLTHVKIGGLIRFKPSDIEQILINGLPRKKVIDKRTRAYKQNVI